MKSIIVLLLIVLNVKLASANNKIYVDLVHISCADSRCLTKDEAIEAWYNAAEFVKSETNIDPIAVSFESVPDQSNIFNVIDFVSGKYQRFIDTYNRFKGKFSRLRKVTVVIDRYYTNPVDNGVFYMAGLTYLCSIYTQNALSVSYVGIGKNPDAKYAVASIIAHEFLHSIGAEHDSTKCNVMYPSLCDRKLLNIPILENTKDDIKFCIRTMSRVVYNRCKKSPNFNRCLSKWKLRTLRKPVESVYEYE